MNFTLSQKDINFIQPLWKFLNILLVTPYYNFDKNVIKHPILSKLHGSLLILARIIWISNIPKNEKAALVWNSLACTQKFSYIFSFANLAALNLLTVINSSLLVDTNGWQMLFTNLQYIDLKLQNKGNIEFKFWNNFYFGFAVKLLVFGAFSFYELYSWTSFLKISYLQGLWNSPFLDLFYQCQIFTLLMCIVQSIKIRYKSLNAKLITCQKSPRIIQELQQLVKIYRMLGETIEIFNKLFGYKILLIIFYSGMQLVFSINFPLASINAVDFGVNVTISNITYVTMILVCESERISKYSRFLQFCFVWMIFLMDSTVQEAETFVDTCYKIQEQFIHYSTEIDTLKKLTSHVQHFTRSFSAGGFFYIKKRLIFSTIEYAATYLIVAIQFNNRM